MVEKQKMVLPGESITTEEEYAPSFNAFAEKGMIKSKIMGVAQFDDNKKEVKVKGKSVKAVREGDIVTGRVMLVKESTVVLELLSAENGKRITGMKTAQLPVRNVSTEYISELKKTMKIGDLVRAKITMASPLAIDLATNEKGLGVIKAYCSNCREEMQYANEKLNCANCGNIEERKWFEAEQKPREFAPRREGNFGDRRGGFGGRPGGFNRGPRREGSFGGNRGRFGGNRGPRRESGFGGGRSFGERGPRKEGHSFGNRGQEGQNQ